MQRVDIAVGAVPESWLVVEVVESHATLPSRPVAPDQMLNPALHERRADLNTGVVWVVSGDWRAVRAITIAAVGIELVDLALWAVLADLVAAIVGMVLDPALGRPADQGDGQQRLGAGRAVLLDEVVGGRAIGQVRRRWRARANILKEVVAGGVLHVDLPVIARSGVAAPAVHRQA